MAPFYREANPAMYEDRKVVFTIYFLGLNLGTADYPWPIRHLPGS